jgi:hypothetical protein
MRRGIWAISEWARKLASISDEEIARRRDEALLRALSTPPKPHKDMKLGKRKAKANPKANQPKKRGQPD